MSVTAAKPSVGGAISKAPLNSTLPTTADAALAAAFEKLGYVSDAGLVRAIELDTETVRAWGGDVVLVLHNGKTETFQFTALDAHSDEVLKLAFGDDNVTGSALASGIAVSSNNKEPAGHAFVVDMLEAGNTLHRIVIPNGVLTSLENITYVDTGAEGYGITITAIADASGNTAYDYFKTASST